MPSIRNTAKPCACERSGRNASISDFGSETSGPLCDRIFSIRTYLNIRIRVLYAYVDTSQRRANEIYSARNGFSERPKRFFCSSRIIAVLNAFPVLILCFGEYGFSAVVFFLFCFFSLFDVLK